jgi:acyl-CoA synthetase (AMP-forming)/AMP-acid ligase II
MTVTASWELDREHEDFRASVRAFVDRHVRPVVDESEVAGRPPAALLKEMGSAGLLGLAVPEEFGGGGGDSLAIVVLSEELARASGGIAVTALVTGYMSTPHIAKFGTDEQRARYLPALVAGEKIASIAVTEPGTGSNVGGITTRVTKVLGAPTLLRKYGDKLAAEHPLPDGETFAWATRHLGGGVPVVNAYGQTETGSTSAYSVAGVEALKPGSTGTAVPGHMYDILDDDGKPVPAGTKGNLVLTQPFPTLARTVWDDPQRYQQAYFSRFPGCYCTNDEAVLDPDGHLWVLGRADDVINVAAHRISTLEIEAIATGHPQVAEAAVVGVADPTKGTVPVGFLTLLDGADPGQVRQEVSAEVSSQLGGYARLGAVYLTSALPKTRTGKIMRRLLRDVVEHGGPQGDISAMEDLAGLQAVQQAVQQAVAAEAAPSA